MGTVIKVNFGDGRAKAVGDCLQKMGAELDALKAKAKAKPRKRSTPPKVAGWNFVKTKALYHCSARNNVFYADRFEAYSYNWWRYIERIGGKLVFNDFSYSKQTCKHQWAGRALLRELGLKIDYCIEAPQGLQRLDSAVDYYESKIKALEQAISRPRSHKRKNAERLNEIAALQKQIKTVKRLIKAKERAYAKTQAEG